MSSNNQYSIQYNLDLTIKITPEEEANIVDRLPAIPMVSKYDFIYEILGEHTPCFYDETTITAKCINMKKSFDGRLAIFACESNDEAKIISKKIKKNLGKYGYKIKDIKDNVILLQNSDITSIAPILSDNQCRAIIWNHDKKHERILFVKNNKNLSIKSLKKIIEKKEKEACQKLNMNISFPKKIQLKYKDVLLPDIAQYSPKFVDFLLEVRPTKYEMMTYLALYHLAELGVPFLHIQKQSLGRIISNYTNMRLRTVEKHLIDKPHDDPLHRKLANIFVYAELYSGLQLYLHDMSDTFSDRLDNHNTS